jgi:hypothetical protein
MRSVFHLRKRQRLRCDLDHIPGPAQTAWSGQRMNARGEIVV